MALLMLKLQITINAKLRKCNMIRIPTHRTPTHPGEMLLEEFLKPMGITQRELADAINVPYQRINEIINGRRGVSPSTALRLAKVFGVSADFWMNIQLRWELYFTMKSESEALDDIEPLPLQHLENNAFIVQHDVGQ
jgi:addiction module HigA family antidote